jgi:hypothetical protein
MQSGSVDKLAGTIPRDGTLSPFKASKGITVTFQFSPGVTAAFKSLVNFVRSGGSWAVIINDLSHTVGISPDLKIVLSSAAALILALDHQAAKPTVTDTAASKATPPA